MKNKSCYHCGKPSDFLVYDDICEDSVYKCKSCHKELTRMGYGLIIGLLIFGMFVVFCTGILK